MFLLSLFHFLYDAILLPSIRLDLRYRLFKVRDSLVNMKIEHGEKINDDVFNTLFFSINSTINRLPYFSISLFIGAKKEFEKNPYLRNKVDKRVQLINSCEIKELKNISRQNNDLAFLAFSLNAGAWLIYLLPILILLYLVKQIFSLALGLKKIIQELTVTSDHDFNRLSPGSFANC